MSFVDGDDAQEYGGQQSMPIGNCQSYNHHGNGNHAHSSKGHRGYRQEKGSDYNKHRPLGPAHHVNARSGYTYGHQPYNPFGERNMREYAGRGDTGNRSGAGHVSESPFDDRFDRPQNSEVLSMQAKLENVRTRMHKIEQMAGR
jgi:hypothetical protein